MILIPIAASPALDGLDFAVDSFGDGIGQPMLAVSQDIIQMLFRHVSDFLDRLQTRMGSPSIPLFEKAAG